MGSCETEKPLEFLFIVPKEDLEETKDIEELKFETPAPYELIDDDRRSTLVDAHFVEPISVIGHVMLMGFSLLLNRWLGRKGVLIDATTEPPTVSRIRDTPPELLLSLIKTEPQICIVLVLIRRKRFRILS